MTDEMSLELTFKSTIAMLKLKGLSPLTLSLEPGEVEHRAVFATDGFRAWWEEVLPNLAMDMDLAVSPAGQIVTLLTDFVSGIRLEYPDDLAEMRPSEEGIWEFRTADVRVFGFFPGRDVFLAVHGDSARNCHDHHLHAGYKNECIRFCDQTLKLSRVLGGSLNDVIT